MNESQSPPSSPVTRPAPSPPTWLSKQAQEKWTQIWLAIDPARVKPELHADSVAIYCQAFGSYCEANEKINAMGPLSKSGDRIITNPYVAIRDTAAKTMLGLSPELGLSAGTGRMTWPQAEHPIETK